MANKKIGSEFAFKQKYLNPLPDLPFEPKLVEYPFEADKDYKWSANSIFEKRSYELVGPTEELCFSLQEANLAAIEKRLNEIAGGTFYVTLVAEASAAGLEADEQFLLSQPTDGTLLSTERSRHRPIVPWLRRTEYIAPDIKRTESLDTRNVDAGAENLTLEEQIKAIERTFEASSQIQNYEHPTDKSLTVAEVYPIYPDFDQYHNEYIQVSFDMNPLASKDLQLPDESEDVKLQEALFKAMAVPDSDYSFISYYIPDNRALEDIQTKRKYLEQGDEVEEPEGHVYTYEHVRDYEFEQKGTSEQNRLFLLLRPRLGAFYNRLGTQLALRRKRAKSKFSSKHTEIQKPSKIVLSRRPLNEQEVELRKEQLARILPLENLEDSDNE